MIDVEGLIASIANLLKAVAWPGVVIFLALRYRDHIGRLVDRLRKGGPAEFDPLPPTQSKPAGGLPAATPAGPGALEPLRTPTVKQWEERIRALPVLAEEPNVDKRESALLALAAHAFLTSLFERTEAVIYASQLELLTYLNAKPAGEATTRLHGLFYNPAVARFPDVYRSYPFENYMSFLQQSMLISFSNLDAIITLQGTEYLLWRLEQHKPPRVVG